MLNKKNLRAICGLLSAVVILIGTTGCNFNQKLDIEKVEIPRFSEVPGAVNKGTYVSCFCATIGAAIYYTTDGQEPSTSSPRYDFPIVIKEPVTLKAMAIKDGIRSEVETVTYTVKDMVATPVCNIVNGKVAKGTELEFSCKTVGASIHYTTDGTVPGAASTVYSSPIVLDSDVTIIAIALKTGMTDSNILGLNFRIVEDAPGQPPVQTVSTPVFSIDAGEVAGGTPLGITCGTSGATIYYTTDGSTPTASSSVYSSPINIDAAMTVKAIAVKSGMNDSAVASASYTLTPTGTDYSTCVIGDIILKDGSICSVDDYVTGSNTAAAVIVRAAADGKPALGVGIVHELNQIEWCKSATSDGQQSITALVGNGTSGYMDGSNSWDLLVEACTDLKNATAETIETVAQDYPAWNYCRTYAETNGLTGDLADGWYLPTVAELKTIYQNKTVVNTSLSKAGGDSLGGTGTEYWSCNQASTSNYARFLDFGSNSVFTKDKKNGLYVCAVRAFN